MTKSNYTKLISDKQTEVHFYDQKPSIENFGDEVLAGLKSHPKTIHPKNFYNEKGSQLFDAITRLPEYYPTRTEIGILKDNAQDISDLIDKNCLLIEYGSGSSDKIRLLLESVRPKAYMPIDISREHLLKSAGKVADNYTWLDVHAACVDYSKSWEFPFDSGDMKRVAFFPGSSIGNLEPEQSEDFLADIARIIGSGGGLLIGVDLKKDPALLNAAYNDSASITAEFNLNILDHINTELNANFNLENFHHHAFFNEEKGRIEMHLESQLDQIVSVEGETFTILKGERIHTENSYKYTTDSFIALAKRVGFDIKRVWQDKDHLFAVFFFEVR